MRGPGHWRTRVHEIGLPELVHADIDRPASTGPDRGDVAQRRQLGAGGAQHPFAQVDDQARLLRHRDERCRRHRVRAAGCCPAQQGFGADHLVGFRTDLRLVVQLEAPGCVRPGAGRLSSAARASTAACIAGSKKRTVLRPAALAWYIATSERLSTSSSVPSSRRRTARRRCWYRCGVRARRSRTAAPSSASTFCATQCACWRRPRAAGPSVVDQHHELVAAQARHGVARRARQPLRRARPA
jgi:hypothetical protein